MKKFFVVLILLIILGGVGFFFGWAQLSVPPGAYGVLQSKTHGVDPHLIQAGEFRWVWYKLIPTNVTLEIFHLETVERTINASGDLPSGAIYSAFAGEQTDFSWEFNASFSFSLSPEALPSLILENNISTQDSLNEYQRKLADSIESFMLRTLSSGRGAENLEAFMIGFPEAMEKMIRNQYPAIDHFSCLVKNIRIPDFILYQQVRGLYEDYIALQRDYAASSMTEKAQARIDAQMRFEELERYGELLTKYPILLDYLAQTETGAAQ